MGLLNKNQEEIVQLYGKLIDPSKARIMSDTGLGHVEERREGIYVWDKDGQQYIDCRDDAGVYNVGRRNPRLIRKLKESLDTYDIGNNLFFSEPRVALAQKLGALSPGKQLTGVVYGVGGGEIVDFALKLARACTKRKKIIAMNNGYHGCTAFAVSATSSESYKKFAEPLVEDVIHVPFNDVKALKKTIDKHTACVILEPVQGQGGVMVPAENYLQEVRRLCDEYGVLMIVDEIQTGLGRTGKFFAVNHEHVVPDIITLGKGLSGGLYPITAAIFKPDLLRFWEEHPLSHLSTFGGSDLGCLVALETIKILEEENLSQKAAQAGQKFAKGFLSLQKTYPNLLKEFRHKGLIMALEFFEKEDGPEMSRRLSEVGILSEFLFYNPKIMRIMPPLIVEDEEIEAILKAFEYALMMTDQERSPTQGFMAQVKTKFQELRS
jgi:putrescine aminotransferase